MGDAINIRPIWVAFLGLLLTAVVTVGSIVNGHATAQASLDARLCSVEEVQKNRNREMEGLRRDMQTIVTGLAVVQRDVSYTRESLDEIKNKLSHIQAAQPAGRK